MGIELHELPIIYEMYRQRYQDRDARHDVIHEIVSGDWASVDPNEDQLPQSAPNLIQVAIEDTGDASAIMPSIRVMPWKNTQGVKRAAHSMEQIAQHYARVSRLDFLLSPTVQNMATYGLAVWIVWPDFDQNVPIIEMRDPRTCYPEPGLRRGERARNCIFSREVYWSQLNDEWKEKIRTSGVNGADQAGRSTWEKNAAITIVEYVDETEFMVTALLKSGYSGASPNPGQFSDIPVLLERWDHGLSTCPVVIGERFTNDDEQRGQFDQVVGPQKAHNRLLDLLVDYADQAVYSDTWVKDPIGEISFGGGSYITLGPNGGIGRVPPAVSSLNVVQDLSMLEEGVHLGGRWPKSRPGEIDQSIASAKFLEASAGMMNTVIKGYHMILKNMIEVAMQLCFETDRMLLADDEKMAYGILRNQEFLVEYSTEGIDPKCRVIVDYGMGLGKDPSQSAVLQIQYAQNGYISEEFVQESIEGVNDVARERARIDAEKFKQIIFGKLIEAVQMGQVSNRQLIDMTKKRYEGDDLFDLFEEFVVKPEEEMMAAGPGPISGLTGQPLGLPPGAPLGLGPGGGPGVPPAPNPMDLMARINTPAGPGGTLGTQAMNEGAPA